MNIFYNFTRLKRTLLIFLLVSFFSLGSFAQSKTLGEDPSLKYMRFFPNPATSVINFEFTNGYDKYFSIEIYNFIGKKVYDARTVTPKITIPLTDFYRGVYIYQLRDRTGKVIESGKFQVTK